VLLLVALQYSRAPTVQADMTCIIHDMEIPVCGELPTATAATCHYSLQPLPSLEESPFASPDAILNLEQVC
jgi:hypothetical protein